MSPSERRQSCGSGASGTITSLLFGIASGKLGSFALEDAACAGLLCRRLAQRGATLHGGAARMAYNLALALRDRGINSMAIAVRTAGTYAERRDGIEIIDLHAASGNPAARIFAAAAC